jgi:hypothetical protein
MEMGAQTPSPYPLPLPPPPRFFAGREPDLARLDAELSGEGVRTTIVSGPHGSGKTALITHWAETRGAERYPDQMYVRLSNIITLPSRCTGTRTGARSRAARGRRVPNCTGRSWPGGRGSKRQEAVPGLSGAGAASSIQALEFPIVHRRHAVTELDDKAAAVVAELAARYGIASAAGRLADSPYPFVEVAGAGPVRVHIVPAAAVGSWAVPGLHIGAHRGAITAAGVIAGEVAALRAAAGTG